MNKVVLIIVLLFITLAMFLVTLVFVYNPHGWQPGLISPNSNTLESVVKSSPSPRATPKIFKFEESSNLKQEVETVNPQVYDQDFTELKAVKDSI